MEAETAKKLPDLSGLNLLSVEDDKFFGGLLEKKFQSAGARITILHSAEEALTFLKKETPDCILLDILLPPGIDGFQFMELKNKDPQTKRIPVIIVTNYGDVEQIKKGNGLGTTEYLIKSSMTLGGLTRKVANLFGKKEREETADEELSLE